MAETPTKQVFCRRNQVLKDASEHLSCPYCFGKKREAVEGRPHEEFCDYDPAKDPVSFGFPEGTTRSERG